MIINCNKFIHKLHSIQDMTKMGVKTAKPTKTPSLIFPS